MTTRPYSRGAQDLAGEQFNNYCDRNVTTACHEFETYWNPYYYCPDGYCNNTNLNNKVSFGMYATPVAKYAVFQTEGTVGTALTWNDDCATGRGFFVESFNAKYAPVGLPSGWKLDDSAPQNANNTGTVLSTTGFSVGASAEVGAGGASGGLSASYSESTTVSSTLTDWQVINKNAPPVVEWDFKLSKTSVGAYNSWKDIYTWSFGSGYYMGTVPAMSSSGFAPRTEAVWKGPYNYGDYLYFDVSSKMTVRRSWCEDYWITADYHSRYSWASRGPDRWTWNLGYVY